MTETAAVFSPQSRKLTISAALACSLLLLTPRAAMSQGCAQCRDNLQATPPAVQQAYRHAIEILALSGLAVFAAGVFAIRRVR